MPKTAKEIEELLAAPFPASEVQWVVMATTGGKGDGAMKGKVGAYIDPRTVRGRFNAVVGIAGWQSDHYPVGAHQMACKIGVYFPEIGWVWKSDGAWVGNIDVDISKAQNPSKAEDEVEKNAKGSFSDAFKRAAFSWGVGEYLYELDSPWITLDDKKRIPREEMPRLNQIADAALGKWQAERRERAERARQQAAKEAAAAAALANAPITGPGVTNASAPATPPSNPGTAQPAAPAAQPPAAAAATPAGERGPGPAKGARAAGAPPARQAQAPEPTKAALPFIEAMRVAPTVARLFEIAPPFRQGQPGHAECEHECATAIGRLMRGAPNKKALNDIATAAKDRFQKDSPEYQLVERAYGAESDRLKKAAPPAEARP